MLICLPDQIAVYNTGTIRPQAHFSSRRIGICTSVFLGNRIMIHHGIHVSGCNKKTQARFPEHLDTLFLSPVRLGDHSYTVASAFQKASDNSRSKRRMIHIASPVT